MRFMLIALLVTMGCSASSGEDPAHCSDGTYAFTLTPDTTAMACPKYPLLKRARVIGREVIVTYADAAGTETLTECAIIAGAGECRDFDIQCAFTGFSDTFPAGPARGSGLYGRGGKNGCFTLVDLEWKQIN